MSHHEIKDTTATLQEIRRIMERSTKFISLSGLSGIMAGIFALIGSAFAHYYWGAELYEGAYYELIILPNGRVNLAFITFFLVDACVVLILSLGFAVYFSARNARRKGITFWDASAKRMLWHLFLPLVVGGTFCLILGFHLAFEWIAPCTLIFYGLAPNQASKYTFQEIAWLGILEMILGLMAAVWLSLGLLFWTIGFGVLHILYGFLMYQKYERTA